MIVTVKTVVGGGWVMFMMCHRPYYRIRFTPHSRLAFVSLPSSRLFGLAQ